MKLKLSKVRSYKMFFASFADLLKFCGQAKLLMFVICIDVLMRREVCTISITYQAKLRVFQM
jgi:hypothetical protein